MTELKLIKRERVTEKASAQAADANHPMFTLVVESGATKGELKRELAKNYAVKPLKVHLIKVPAKKIIYRGRVGQRPGFKKALVFLAKGEKIEVGKK